MNRELETLFRELRQRALIHALVRAKMHLIGSRTEIDFFRNMWSDAPVEIAQIKELLDNMVELVEDEIAEMEREL